MVLEITDLNNIYLKDNKLSVELLDDDAKWLDAGTHDSLLEAGLFVRNKELETQKKIACLEEIAYRLDLTRERVRQIKDKALKKLKQHPNRNLLRMYLEQ